MSSFNQVLLIGNVGSVNVRVINEETKVCDLSVATTQKGYTRKDGTVVEEHTEWHRVVLWRGLAEVCEKFVKKGTQVHIVGELRTRDWTDKEGSPRHTTEIMARNLSLLGKADGEAKAEAPKAETAERKKVEHQRQFVGQTTDNDLPF